jgi:hypothetical protein
MLTDDCTDLSKAVMEDGEWFLVPAEHVDSFIQVRRESIIVHRCHKWTAELLSPNGLPYEPLGYWVSADAVQHCCKLCNVHPPEAIANLFLIHNFDTFASDPPVLSRIIQRKSSLVFHQWDLEHFVQDATRKPCSCRYCHDNYGDPI